MAWEEFQMYFKSEYFPKRYYDKNINEFHGLKLGQMTMDEYIRRFLELLKHAYYIQDDNIKMQRFISGLPWNHQEKIEFVNPNTLEEVFRKARCCYEKDRGHNDLHKAWKEISRKRL